MVEVTPVWVDFSTARFSAVAKPLVNLLRRGGILVSVSHLDNFQNAAHSWQAARMLARQMMQDLGHSDVGFLVHEKKCVGIDEPLFQPSS